MTACSRPNNCTLRYAKTSAEFSDDRRPLVLLTPSKSHLKALVQLSEPVENPSPLDWGTAPDWSTIPAPTDDGATSHLPGVNWPPVSLEGTDGQLHDLSALQGLTVVYAYPRTGQPGVENPDGWDLIPGARGCTPQSCSFRDHFAEFKALGVDQLFGLSTQGLEYQREAAERLHLPFPILSDEHLILTQALNLPTFKAGSMTLLKRCSFIIIDGKIEHIFYPVFPPDQSASEVKKWLSARKTKLQID